MAHMRCCVQAAGTLHVPKYFAFKPHDDSKSAESFFDGDVAAKDVPHRTVENGAWVRK